MGFLGVHHALTEEQAEALCQAAGDDERLRAFCDDLDDRRDEKWRLYGDEFWNGLHRCLTDGSLRQGTTPLHAVVLGSYSWHEGEDYLVNLLEPEQVRASLGALRDIDRTWLRARYDALDPVACDWRLCEEDFERHWQYFERVRSFFARAAEVGRWVAFAVNF